MSEAARRLDDLRLALGAAVRAGERVAADFGAHGDVRMKTPDQPVTEADLAVDRELRERLLGERPDYGWLSEETRDDRARLACDFVWIVDPIDGTRSFIEGYPESVVCVGLADGREGAAVVGVVHNPMTGELYWAVRGGGAYGVLVETARTVEVEAPLTGLARTGSVADLGPDGWGRYMIVQDVKAREERPRRMMTSRSSEPEELYVPEGWVRIRRGSTAYKMVGVAAGVADAYLARGPKSEWDVCAAALIVEEAGGRVTDLSGAELRFNRPESEMRGVVCAGDRDVHAMLLDWLPDAERVSGAGGAES